MVLFPHGILQTEDGSTNMYVNQKSYHVQALLGFASKLGHRNYLPYKSLTISLLSTLAIYSRENSLQILQVNV